MIEFEGQQLSNEDVLEAIKFGHKAIITICEMINELRDLCGKEKWAYEVPDTAELVGIMNDKLKSDYQDARRIEGKQDRSDALRTLFRTLKDELMPADEKEPKYSSQLWSMAKEDFEESIIRQEILDGNRAAGRGYDEVRTIECEVDVIPLVHGSALFTRGETQTLSTITLGTLRDEQIVDGIRDEVRHKFMLHYNFPPFCVGEARRIMGPGRREIGHGALAERSLIPVLPDSDKFPYTIRLNSDVMESNGSSSMATICGGTLSMMAAGVPLKAPVAGISVGAVSDDSKTILITDILGEEDHYGDMDFKVAGTREGITGIQLDLKNRGISYDMIAETLVAAEKARNGILDTMLDTISDAREEMAESAPRITSIKIPQDMIGKIIGPGGKEIKRLQEDTGTNVEIEEDGTVLISCIGGDGHERAKNIIRSMVEPIKIGATYGGKVTTVKDFGAFIEIAPGKDGLCHVSELSHGYISNVTDVCKEGDLIDVKVIDVDEQGRIKLSIKALTEKPAKEDAAK
jgi:polyribonucleotide nucleotidyltransferase